MSSVANRLLDLAYGLQGALIRAAFPIAYNGSEFLDTLHALLETQHLSPDEIQALQLKRLQSRLEYVYHKVPYYRQVMQERKLPPEYFTSLDHLQAFPVLTKEAIRAHIDELIPEDYPQNQLIRTATGGSTGEPTPLVYTKEYISRRQARTMRGLFWTGWQPGRGWVRAWGANFDVKASTRLVGQLMDWLQRRLVLPAWRFSGETLPGYLRRTALFRPYLIEGYRSALKTLAEASIETGIPLAPQAVISSAETLYPHDRQIIESAWNTRVFNRYGCREVGTIAHEGPDGHLYVSAEAMIVELTDDDTEPTQLGDIGHILVTNFDNPAMPFIRYKVGDQAQRVDQPSQRQFGLPVLGAIQGRETDILLLDNNRRLDGLIFYHLLKDYPVQEFQVRQVSGDEVRMLVVPLVDFELSHEEDIRRIVCEYLGEGIRFSIEKVDALPKTATHKLRRVIGLEGGSR